MPKPKPKIVIPPAAFPIPVNRLDHLRPAVNHPLAGNDHEHADWELSVVYVRNDFSSTQAGMSLDICTMNSNNTNSVVKSSG